MIILCLFNGPFINCTSLQCFVLKEVVVDQFKLQVVEKDGHLFALNSAQLDLCRKLELDAGVTLKVAVEIVPSQHVPTSVWNLMKAPHSVANVPNTSAFVVNVDEVDLRTEHNEIKPANRDYRKPSFLEVNDTQSQGSTY